MQKSQIALAAIGALCTGSAMAADIPLKAPPPPAQGSFYLRLDDYYDVVRLPTYSLGAALSTTPTAFGGLYNGQVNQFDPHTNGNGFRGALGYVIPNSDLRAELVGSYAKTTATQSAATTVQSENVILLNGFVDQSGGNAIAGIPVNSTLSTTYISWAIGGKVLKDIKAERVTWSPFIEVFGGNSHERQGLSQTLFNQPPPGNPSPALSVYAASTDLGWTDVGAKVGVSTKFDVSPQFSLGLVGSLAIADRMAHLDGSDSFTFVAVGRSTVSFGTSTGVFLAHGEANATYWFMPALAIRGFVGVNFDSRVPGLVAPTYAGLLTGTGFAVPTTRVGITYAGESSYYAGGGVALKF
jgi:hypothetical protein